MDCPYTHRSHAIYALTLLIYSESLPQKRQHARDDLCWKIISSMLPYAPTENITTHCWDLERREVSLLVETDMDEHIEKTFGQFCYMRKCFLLCLLKCEHCWSSLDLCQCICTNMLKPDCGWNIGSERTLTFLVDHQPCLLSISVK